jgi:hypothetical protein
MMKREFLFILIIIMLSPEFLHGQFRTQQAGLRSGYRSGIFYQITNEAGSAESGYNALLSFGNKGIQLTGLRVIYVPLLTDISPDLFFVWGYGAHAGFVHTKDFVLTGDRSGIYLERFSPAFGVDGWVGAEYRFRDVPLNISMNLKPYAEFTIPAFLRVMPFDLGISVSYVF